MSFLNQLLRDPHAAYQLINSRNRRIVATDVMTAFDSASRRRGLLRTDSLMPGRALIIAPTNAIHTWFMRFDIDVAFVAKDGRIVKVRHQLRPWRFAGAIRGFAAIELPSGTLAGADTLADDVLALAPLSSPSQRP
jgi:uncharacterized membrane protein (UPF0127 family)